MEVGRFYNTESMDMNALFQQDIDLGINWPSYEPVKNLKDVNFNSKEFIVDGETGEYVPNPQRDMPQKNLDFDAETGQNPDFNLEECLDLFGTSGNVQTVAPVPTVDQSFQPLQNNSDTINKDLWDDIATLSEAYLALDSGDLSNGEMSDNGNCIDMENGQFQQLNQYQNEVFGSPQSLELPETTMRKEQYFSPEPAYHGFPTPPYQEQSDSPQTFAHPTSVTFPPESSEKLYGPANIEETKLTELLLSQQNELLAQLDAANTNLGGNVPPAPVINAEQVETPGGWFFNRDEPENNFSQVLTELDLMNNMPNQTSAYLNPPNAPYVPPPITMDVATQGRVLMVSESESLDSGYSDAGMTQHMDIEMQDKDVIRMDSQILSTVDSKQMFVGQEKDAELKAYSGKKMNQRISRDLKKARELNINLTMDQIINSPVEEYNEILTRSKLSPSQQALIRDIRRRGKNKVAAQNCRKRKIETIASMEIDIDELNMKRQELINQQREIEETRRNIQGKYKQLYKQIFTSLRDESGRPYDQSNYSLQQVEGAIILVPGGHGNEIVNDKMNKKREVAFFDLSKVKIEKDI